MLVIAAISACVLVYLFNPSDVNWMPRCPVHALTGYQCPSCGSTRAVHQFLHGNFAAGLRYNPFVLYSWPYFIFVVVYEYLHKGKVHPRWFWVLAYVYLALYCAWWVLRNILSI